AGREELRGQMALPLGRCAEPGAARSDALPGAMGDLADGPRRFAENFADRLIWIGEGFSQDVGRAFLRSEPLEEKYEGEGDVIAQLGGRLGRWNEVRGRYRFREPRPGIGLAGGPGRSQVVEAEAGDDRG